MKFIKFIFKFSLQIMCAILLAGLFGFIHPALDSLSHVRLHLSVILLIAALLALFFKDYKHALIGFVIGALGFYLSLEGTKLSAQTHDADKSKPVYSLLHFNLLWNNPRKEEVRNRIIRLDPDIITVTETTRGWERVLDTLGNQWSHRYMCHIWKNFGGTKIYSKWPIINGSEVCLEYASNAIVTLIPPDGKPIVFMSPHFRWPWPASGPEQLQDMKPVLEKTSKDVLVAGDFNATTWSWAMKDFAQTAGLQIYPGIGSTWIRRGNRFAFLLPFGLPIDNVMQKGRVNILSAQTLPNWGSDHLPILVKFQLND